MLSDVTDEVVNGNSLTTPDRMEADALHYQQMAGQYLPPNRRGSDGFSTPSSCSTSDLGDSIPSASDSEAALRMYQSERMRSIMDDMDTPSSENGSSRPSNRSDSGVSDTAAQGLRSRMEGLLAARAEGTSLHSDPLNMARLTRVLRTSNDTSLCLAKTERYASLVDHLGLDHLTLSDIDSVRSSGCLSLVENCRCRDGSSIFFVRGDRCVEFLARAECNALVRAACFMLESRDGLSQQTSVTSRRHRQRKQRHDAGTTVVIDAEGVDWADAFGPLATVSGMLCGAFPFRLVGVYVVPTRHMHKKILQSGDAAKRTSARPINSIKRAGLQIALATIKLRLGLSNKLRGRVHLVDSISDVIDVAALHEALRDSGGLVDCKN